MRYNSQAQRFYESADDQAVRVGDWWFADIQGGSWPVRLADKNDRLTWNIDGRKVAVIDLPEPEDEFIEVVLASWAQAIILRGEGWIIFAIQVYNDIWTFQNGDPKYLRRLKMLEHTRDNSQWE